VSGLASLASLEGVWSLDRIVRHSDGREDVFSGTSTFLRSGPRLVQNEDGMLTPAGSRTPLKATRTYIWTQNDNQIDVMFDDMRPFHRFQTGVDAVNATHLCPPDRYEVAYDFAGFPRWSSTWTVEGPRKAYKMTNLFVRAS